MHNPDYIGRFAPSPTGPLHLGSLVSALGSWADAKHHNGKWLVRIEDIDPQRESPEATEQIVASLDAHDLHSDEEITFQHNNASHYDQALDSLRNAQRLYACTCTRKSLRALNQSNYPGTCRSATHTEDDRALRVLLDSETINFEDLVCGHFSENVSQSTGDFIVRRRGPFYAYQLAVVVDDSHQRITHVVRGADLLDNTARQIALQRLLGFTTPAYLHLPLALQTDGRKLSKQTGAEALNDEDPLNNLRSAWKLLGQIPATNPVSSCSALLEQYSTLWDRNRIPVSGIYGSGAL